MRFQAHEIFQPPRGIKLYYVYDNEEFHIVKRFDAFNDASRFATELNEGLHHETLGTW